MRTCFLHIGTYKTGTTSIQLALGARYEELRRRGLLYPLSGRTQLPPGHHTIAEALCVNRQLFVSEQHDKEELDALLREITDSDCDVIVLSSEVFHSAAHGPEKFGAFLDTLRSRGLEVVIVTYLRNQIDCARSLYLTLVQLGLTDTFEEFLQVVLELGRALWKGTDIAFCYTTFLKQLERVRGVRIIVRSYDHLGSSSVVADFLSMIGLDPATVPVDTALRANPTPPLIDLVLKYYGHCTGRPAHKLERRMVSAVLGTLDATRAALSMRSKRKIVERFAASNRQLFADYDVPEFTRMRPDNLHSSRVPGDGDGGISLERIFSSRVRSCMRAWARLADRATAKLA